MAIRRRSRDSKVTDQIYIVQCSGAGDELEPATRSFGPFVSVPSDEVKPAGFACRHCKRPVEVARKTLPGMVPRICVYACRCGAVLVWEDETQPRDAKHWYWNVKLLKKSGTAVAIFNGNKPLSPGFSGLS